VVLVGQVGKPGIIVFKDGLTLTQAIELAGGIPQGLAVKSVKIFEPKGRSGDKLRGTYDLEKIQAGRMGDIKLNPGDRVEVGKLTRKDRESFRVPLGSGGSPK
jgi:protein involved in polysaccharide export with SLBB domain